MIILPRVIGQRFLAQLTAGPREIKRMFQEMFLRDVIVDAGPGICSSDFSGVIFGSDRLAQIFTDNGTEFLISVW